MKNIMGEEIPDKLYKYMPWPVDGKNYTKEIFINKKIHLSKPKDFNDPFEFKVNYVPSLTVKPDVFTVDEYKDACKKTSEKMDRFHQNDNWVTCMTKCPNNILMWSHYAAKHTGIYLELKILTKEIMKVDYDELYPKIDIEISLKEDVSDSELYDLAKTRSARKSLLWHYEEEYRYVTPNTSNMINGENFVLLKDFAEITGIVCGCRMEEKTVFEIEKFLKEQAFDIPVKRAKTKEKEYGLDII